MTDNLAYKGDCVMTVLRDVGEGVKLTSDMGEIRFTIFGIKNGKVQLGIDAPEELNVLSGEIYHRIQANLIQQTEAYYYSEQTKQREKLNAVCGNLAAKGRILLVEDTDIIRKVNSVFLAKAGYQVDAAIDGKSALDHLQNYYDLILLDVGLPDINGIEVCKIIRKHPKHKNTKIIFLTAYGDEIKSRCINAGGDAFAVKPLSMEKLGKLVSRFCSCAFR